MKQALRTIFWPVLKRFEKDNGPYHYKPLNRKILLVLGCLFLFLSLAVLVVAPKDKGLAFLLPVVIFGAVSLVSLVVATLGSDRAVSTLWGNK